MSGQPHVPAALPPVKELPVPNELKVGWALDRLSTLVEEILNAALNLVQYAFH